MGSIFYGHNVVGGVVYCTNDIYGGRTHSACRYRWHKRLWRIKMFKLHGVLGSIFYKHNVVGGYKYFFAQK